MENAVPHPESVAYLVHNNSFQKSHILFSLILNALISDSSDAFDEHLLKRLDAGSIFDGAQPINIFIFKELSRSISIVY